MKRIILIFAIVALIFCFSACSGNNDSKNTVTTLSESDFAKAVGYEDVDIRYSRPIDGTDAKLASKNAKLVLIEYTTSANKTKFDLCVAEYDTASISLFDYGSFAPLEIIKDEFIDKFPESDAINNTDIIAEFTEQYGIDCFDDNDVCELYLKRLTKNSKLINIDSAKKAIKQNITSKVPKLDIYDELEIIFEPRSAVPRYYAFEDYNKYGELCWMAMDSDFEIMPNVEFESFDDLKDHLVPSREESKDRDDDNEDEDDFEDSEDDNLTKDDSHSEDFEKEEDKNVIYRVRKSANDANSQLGAFEVLDNAKALANQHKDDGYKVYDSEGNLVYAP